MSLPLNSVLNPVSSVDDETNPSDVTLAPAVGATLVDSPPNSSPAPYSSSAADNAISPVLHQPAHPPITTVAVSPGESTNYDSHTILILLRKITEAGYGNRKELKKSLREVFAKAVDLARKDCGVRCSPKAWQKKFTRMKQEYSAYMAKLAQSGRDGHD